MPVGAFERALRERIEPIAREAGFEWIQPVTSLNDEWAALFEAEEEDFIRRFPHFFDQGSGYRSGCVDLWIYYHALPRQAVAYVGPVDVARELEELGEKDLADRLRGPADVTTDVRNLEDVLRVVLTPRPTAP